MSEELRMQPGWTPVVPLMTLHGTRADSGERSISMPYGHTTCWARPSRALTKAELEFWQLGQFCIDLYTGTGELLTSSDVHKRESPDFILSRVDDSDLGVEIAAFTPSERRAHESHVDRIRSIMASDPDAYRHLDGCHLWLTIEADNPPRVVHEHRDAILQSLRSSARPQPLTRNAYDVAPHISQIGRGEHWHITGYELVPEADLGASVLTPLAFEIVYGLERTISDISSELERIVGSHLFEGVDYLLVPIVGPDVIGVAFHEDEALILSLLEQGAPRIPARRGTRILLHFWTSGRIVEIAPDYRDVSPDQPDHTRRLTILARHDGRLFCAPLSQPSLRLDDHD
jgi:hypothetical protein